VTAAAGWYADPSGVPGQLRWWDGARWTEHVTADPTATTVTEPSPDTPANEATETASGAATSQDEGAVTGATTSPEDRPATGAVGTAAALGATSAGGTTPADDAGSTTPSTSTAGGAEHAAGDGSTQPPPPTGQPSSRPRRSELYAQTPAWSTETTTAGSTGVRTGLIVAAVVGVLLLVVVGIFVVVLVRADGGVNVEVGDRPAATVDTGELRVGESVTATIPEEGLFRATLTVDEPGTVALDVRGEGDFDAVLEVFDEGGTWIAENDDRDEVEDGRLFDPYLELDLDPGTYIVEVRGWSGEAGTFELSAG
jgi:hypothetical protein